MSLLSIATDVTDVIGLTRPIAIINGQDQLSRQILGLAKKTLEELGLMDWPVLEVPYSFVTVPNQSQYTLPDDFGREIGDSVYTGTRYAKIRGGLTPGDWARQRNTLPNLGQFKFRIFGYPPKLNITPTPTTAETLVLEYQTTNRVVQSGGVLKTTYFDDADVSLVPEDLMKKGLEWRLRRAKGLDYSEEFDDYEQSRAQRLAQQMQTASIPVSYRSVLDDQYQAYPYVPEIGFGV